MPVDLTGAMLRRLKPNQLTGQVSGTAQISPQTSSQTPSQTPAQTPANIVTPYGSSTNDYDYDPEYDTVVRQLAARQNFLNSQATQGRNRVNTNYQMPFQDMQNQYGTDLQSLAAQMAQQGILRSSNNLYSQGRLSDAYQRQYGGLLSQRQQQLESVEQQRAQGMQDILEQQINALGKHTQFVGEKEKERAALEAQTKAAEEGRKRQEDLAKQLAQQAAEAQQAFQQVVNPPPPTQTTPTGAIVPSPQTTDPDWLGRGWDSPSQLFTDPRVGGWDDPRFAWMRR